MRTLLTIENSRPGIYAVLLIRMEMRISGAVRHFVFLLSEGFHARDTLADLCYTGTGGSYIRERLVTPACSGSTARKMACRKMMHVCRKFKTLPPRYNP